MTEPQTPKQAELLRKRRARARLKRATEKLDAFLFRLQALHADRSGSFRMMYPRTPLLPDEWYVVERSVGRNEREASDGCSLAAAWIAETAEIRTQIDALRNTPLPEKDPTYAGPMVFPAQALRAGKRRPVCSTRRIHAAEETAAIVAGHVAKLAERKARSRALLEEFLAGA
jgi:hypothetical protein